MLVIKDTEEEKLLNIIRCLLNHEITGVCLAIGHIVL